MSDPSPQEDPLTNSLPPQDLSASDANEANEAENTSPEEAFGEDLPQASLRPQDDGSENPASAEIENRHEELDELAVAEAVEPLEATVVESSMTGLALSAAQNYAVKTPPPIAAQFENLAASGGAVTAVVLGILTIIGGLFSAIAAINGVLGISMGLWGLASRHKTMAYTGILLCLLGIFWALFRPF